MHIHQKVSSDTEWLFLEASFLGLALVAFHSVWDSGTSPNLPVGVLVPQDGTRQCEEATGVL